MSSFTSRGSRKMVMQDPTEGDFKRGVGEEMRRSRSGLAALISWLSSAADTAKQGAVYLRQLYSLHSLAPPRRHTAPSPGTTQICLAGERGGTPDAAP
ncbi:hypothetical protein AAFF_G00284480 [Aldrovandia affinis]|uniref:Uncharacterized protein n=1 Tax=Aldrovandia affinis TaxID=143900 RepID=A0AAD7X141_9TELE|nr:hypothetical protein AAFF_G00284480 [Aldrovandia affinis]